MSELSTFCVPLMHEILDGGPLETLKMRLNLKVVAALDESSFIVMLLSTFGPAVYMYIFKKFSRQLLVKK